MPGNFEEKRYQKEYFKKNCVMHNVDMTGQVIHFSSYRSQIDVDDSVINNTYFNNNLDTNENLDGSQRIINPSILTTAATDTGASHVDSSVNHEGVKDEYTLHKGDDTLHKGEDTLHKDDDTSQQSPYLWLSTTTTPPPQPPPQYKSLVNHFILDGPPTYEIVVNGYGGKHPNKVGFNTFNIHATTKFYS